MKAEHSRISALLSTRNLVLFSVVIELVLFYFYYYPSAKIFLGDEQRYLNTGLSIAAGGDWHSNPLWPPMQPLLIALFAKIFNNPLLPLQIFQYCLLLLSGFVVRDIIWRETGNKTSAQISLAVMILYPSWLAYSQYLWPEIIHVLLFVSIIWLNKYKNHSTKWMLLSGLLLAVMILFKSLLILLVPILYLPLLFELSWRQALLRISLSLLLALLVLAPAAMKAHKMTGGWMVSNSSMFNLWFGLNDDRRQNFAHDKGRQIYQDYMDSGDSYKQRNEVFKDKALNKIKENGYVQTLLQQLSKQYFRLFDYQSFFSQQFQGDKAHNYKNKYQHRSNEPLVTVVLIINTVFYWLLMLSLFVGTGLSFRHSIIAKQFALLLLYVLALFLLLHSKPRFRIPLLPVMAYASAYTYHYVIKQKISIIGFFYRKKTIILTVIYLLAVTLLIFAASQLDKIYPI